MKTKMMLCAFIVSVGLCSAQSGKKSSTVRIKKVETINGVTKITDTTYTSDDPALSADEMATAIETGGENGDVTVISSSRSGNKSTKTRATTTVYTCDGTKTEKIVIQETDGEQTVIHVGEETPAGEKGKGTREDKKKTTIIIKKVKITDPTEADAKTLGKTAAPTGRELAVKDLNFYPNPGNGKFKLSFALAGNDDVEITVMDMQGSIVYKETVTGFAGTYEKEIDLTGNSRGVYFLNVRQGDQAQLKKIVLQ